MSDAAYDFTTYTTDSVLTISTRKGDPVTGTFVSVNSKGVNLRVNGKVVSRSVKAITGVTVAGADAFDAGTDYTAKALATIFGTSARRLRVQLRKMGLGVGQGHMYHLTATQAKTVRDALNKIA